MAEFTPHFLRGAVRAGVAINMMQPGMRRGRLYIHDLELFSKN
jgi:hypothetical protein